MAESKPLRSRRIVVGWVEVESAPARMFRMAAQGITDPHEKPQVELRQINGQGEAPTYWCAADKPLTDVRAVYRTNEVRELQTMLGEAWGKSSS